MRRLVYRQARIMVAPMSRFLIAAFAALALAGCAAPQAAAPLRVYANPVLDSDFPDPAVLRAADGHYYAYATQTERDGKMINMQVARSADLVTWQHLGDALPVKPAWAAKTQDFWAPHGHYADGRYYLYYSAKPDAALTDDKRGLCLAVATADRPEGPFTDIGQPLQCGDGFINIDPMAYDDPATPRRVLKLYPRLDAEAKTRLNKVGVKGRFHWPLEFPEVIVKRNGFDAFVGNPPFMGGSRITGGLGDREGSGVRHPVAGADHEALEAVGVVERDPGCHLGGGRLRLCLRRPTRCRRRVHCPWCRPGSRHRRWPAPPCQRCRHRTPGRTRPRPAATATRRSRST